MKKLLVIVGMFVFACQPEPKPKKAEPATPSVKPDQQPKHQSNANVEDSAHWWVSHAAKYSQECVWAEQTRWYEKRDRPVDTKCRKKWRAHVSKVDHRVPMNIREATWIRAWEISKKNEKPFAKGRIAKYLSTKPKWNPDEALKLLTVVLERSPGSVDARHAIWAVAHRPAFKPLLKKIANGTGDNVEEAGRYLTGKP